MVAVVVSSALAVGAARSRWFGSRAGRVAVGAPGELAPPAVPVVPQVLEQAVTWQLLDRNPTDRIRNRRVKLDEDREIRPFASWDEVTMVADELRPAYRALPFFLVGTGMRPEEALALEWYDVDKANALAIERVHSQGRTKPCKKSDRRRRCRCERRCWRRSTSTRAGSTHDSSSPATTATT